jgi:hypothetical protein
MPAALSFSIWSIRMTELRAIMPVSANTPRMATKPRPHSYWDRRPRRPACSRRSSARSLVGPLAGSTKLKLACGSKNQMAGCAQKRSFFTGLVIGPAADAKATDVGRGRRS